MIKLNDLRTDRSAENEGRWFTLSGGWRVKIAATNNAAYRALYTELIQPHVETLRANKRLPDDVAAAIGNECVAKTIIRDWEPVEADNGEVFSYSVENAMTLLEDEAMHRVHDEIIAIASNAARYRVEIIEGAKKN